MVYPEWRRVVTQCCVTAPCILLVMLLVLANLFCVFKVQVFAAHELSRTANLSLSQASHLLSKRGLGPNLPGPNSGPFLPDPIHPTPVGVLGDKWSLLVADYGFLVHLLALAPKLWLAVSIMIFEKYYRRLARWLNDMENHRLEEDYRTHMVVKLVLVLVFRINTQMHG